MKFKVLAAILIVIPFAWLAWWWLLASATEDGIDGWLADRRAEGWQAEVSDIAVNGFPNRIDATLRNPALADPMSGWAWEAERLAIRQVAYDPTFFVIHFPPEQRLAAPGARATLRAEVMEASLKVSDASTLAVERASFDMQRAGLAADAGWTASAERLTVHTRVAPDAGPENAYQFRADAVRLRPPDFLRRIADPAGALPQTLDRLVLEGRVALDRPLDRFAAEGAKPQIRALTLKEAAADWGPLALALDGALAADEDGYAEGEIDVAAVNWREMIDAAVAAGFIPETFANALRDGLGFIAGLGGDPDRLEATLVFSGGYMRIGPVPIGAAPRLMR